MKAKWCQNCKQLMDAAFIRCPNCGSLSIVDVKKYIKRLLKIIKKRRKTKKQEQRYEEPDDGHMSLGEEQAMRSFGIKV